MKKIFSQHNLKITALLTILTAAVSTQLFAGTMDEIKRVEESQALQEEEKIIRPVAVYRGRLFNDPFRSRKKNDTSGRIISEPVLPLLTIQGIVWGAEVPQAIINNQVMRVGDSVGGAHIVDIKKEGIKVIFQGQGYTIPAPAFGLAPADKALKKDTAKTQKIDGGGIDEP